MKLGYNNCKSFNRELLFYCWKSNNETGNWHPNGSWSCTILGKSFLIFVWRRIHIITIFFWSNQGKIFPLNKTLHMMIFPVQMMVKKLEGLFVMYIPRSLNWKLDIKWSCYVFEFGYNHQEGTFIYKLFDKRDSFPFSFVRMPHIERKIPQNFFIQQWKSSF